MRVRLSASLAILCSCLLAFALLIPSSSAQEVFVTPIANSPFSGVVKVERTIINKDGSVMQLKTSQSIARDTRGRIHNERHVWVPASSTETPRLMHVHLYDPQTRISTEINVKEQTYWTRTMNHAPSTKPPAIRFAAPVGDNPPNDFAKEEDLGVHEIEGVPARGVRETQVIPAEGDAKEVTIIDEYWYSEDLRIYMMVKHSDPRSGTTTTTVTQVSRNEPDAAVFEIPAGYKPRN